MRFVLMVLCALCWAGPALAQAQQRLALVIGNQNYEQVRKLENALADARAVAAALRERGFDVTDRYDLNRVGMLREFDAFRRRIVSGSVVVFYFAGHGVALEGSNYLLPTDIARENEEQARYDALPLETVMSGLQTQNNRSEHGLNLLIIDACRDNPFRNYTRSGGAPAGLSTKPGAGLMMLYAAASGQAALDKLGDADRDPNGVFTRTLLRAMRTPGLGVRAMAAQVQHEVGALSGRRQVPAFYSEALGDYVFTPGAVPTDDAAARRVAELERQVEELRRGQAGPVAGDAATRRLAEPRRELEQARQQPAPARQQEASLTRPPAQAPAPAVAAPPVTSTPLRTFRDCAECPEMVTLPLGSFVMGSPAREAEPAHDEGPQRTVRVTQSLAVGKYEVTFGEWEACVAAGGCSDRLGDAGWGRGRRPVINVSWEEAQGYVRWLSSRTGQRYRLLTEAEWEYAARAGTVTAYSFGSSITPQQANYYSSGVRRTVEVGRYPANGWGLHDLHGNVSEWVEDCYRGNYAGAPVDAATAVGGGECSSRVLRGGSWGADSGYSRSAGRYRYPPNGRADFIGFRVARTPG